ncbi:MAG: CRISPR-associated protein Cas5 [Candidatus Hydrothermae bacterium]|nr:CRISPR-associated protein Cas5 [Candidatus Hydrothermae bacterium]
METLVLRVRAPQVSFRRPLDINFQRTLPLPPPTTLIGLAGAALGLSDYQIWNDENWRPLRELKVASLLLKQPGRGKDMMTVLKIKNNRIEQRSPYFRELLFDVEYLVIYSGDADLLKRLKNAFNDPFYPLSLGREDELVEIVEMKEIQVSHGGPTFYGTAIPGDIREYRIEIIDFDNKKKVKLEPAVIENVPTRFSVQKGRRVPIKKATLTFLPYLLKVKIADFEQEVFTISGRNFTWMNY